VSKAIDAAAGAEREVVSTGPTRRSGMRNDGYLGGDGEPETRTVTAPATDDARQWQGWGTALKPAWEPIILARKPLIGTVAGNVLAHGTGALNIDACRVELNGDYKSKANGRPSQTGLPDNYDPDEANLPDTAGRWPANLIHDGSGEVLAQFPANAGASAPVRGTEASLASHGNVTGIRERVPGAFHNDTGSAARFFYCAKASKSERESGLEQHEDRLLARSNQARAEGDRGNTVEAEAGGYNKARIRKNNHPTVKPTELMRYLCRLVTPPGGTVLDPFMGSGSTGRGAMLEGFRFIGIEQDPEYAAIAEARIEDAVPAPVEVPPQSDLFALVT
jgi:hypothetical protein